MHGQSTTRAIQRLLQALIGLGRTHHHVSKLKSEDQMRRPTNATDMKMKSFVTAHTMSEESVTCIAAKEDRHQKSMSSVKNRGHVRE